MPGRTRALLLLGLVGPGLAGCRGDGSARLFEELDPGATGVTFVNALPEDPAFDILEYLNYYNGGGVAVGDIDEDGLVDLYFTSNAGSNRLYRNLGDYRFEDVTERAGVEGSEGWTTGATMADVDGDGLVDIYVSAVDYLTMNGRNILYINRGDGTFADETETFGLGHVGYGTQAAFFDYDLDGDLDAYLLNHSVHAERGNSFSPQREAHHPRSGDRLLRNDGGRFVDVTAAAGIYGGVEGYGLGIAVSDLDLDGCPDVYVANDFQENDFLYFNGCDGTFTEAGATSLGHTSLSSMGVDAADFDNDGRPDLVVLDMLPEREDILKTSANAESYEIEDRKLQAGYGPQYARNTLQLNRGRRRFSEIGYLAGVHATDWSWAPLLADLDNDADKDLLITNGIYRRPNDLDYIARVRDPAVQATLRQNRAEVAARLVESMPHVPIANFAFRNEGGLEFTSSAAEWGLDRPGFSHGAAYADLNNDGGLDLVLNNLDAPASIYRSHAPRLEGRHFLTVLLEGSGANTDGIGAKVVVRHGDTRQLLEQMPTRGFQSSVDPRLHFGLGPAGTVDSLIVVWPDRSFQVLTGVEADRRITLSQEDAGGRWRYGDQAADGQPAIAPVPASRARFEDVTSGSGIELAHEENDFFDYRTQPLMPHALSTEGPALAVGDADGDGLDDLFVGGAKHQPGRLLLQRPDGSFRGVPIAVFETDALHEDVAAAFLDADGDGDADLYVASGGNEFWGEHEALVDRLYLGDGRGGFTRSRDRLPDAYENGSCVVPGDFDADGDVDLFVGSRVVTREYGRAPASRLLENDGTGRFVDVTDEKADGLARVGMVTSAAWLEDDGDGRPDLVVVGEWMPVTVFRQEGDRFVDRTGESGLASSTGWWNRVLAADLTGDGREDLVLGNLGLNSYVRASPGEPARLYVHDFDRNGSLDQVLTFYKGGTSYPFAGRDELLRQMPHLRERYPTYAEFGASRIEDLIPEPELSQARVLEARVLASSVALDRGDGTFALEPLPVEAQLAPVYGVLAGDFDGDDRVDLVVAGNLHGVPPARGRYDASYGLLLLGDGAGGFRPVDMEASGLLIDGEVRDLRSLERVNGDRLLVVARNDDRLQVLRRAPGAGHTP